MRLKPNQISFIQRLPNFLDVQHLNPWPNPFHRLLPHNLCTVFVLILPSVQRVFLRPGHGNMTNQTVLHKLDFALPKSV